MPHFAKGALALFCTGSLALCAGLSAQAQAQAQVPSQDSNIVVEGERYPDPATLPLGPEIKGIIVARNSEKIKVAAEDGTRTVIAVVQATKIKAAGGLFKGGKAPLGPDALINGLPVTVRTGQWNGGLVATQVTFKANDLKTARMIQSGTAQQFEEQSAATEALRSRMGDIDKYNIKATVNVYFATGKSALSIEAKQQLCQTASEAQATDNALMLVVGYTDSVGSEEANQILSERRAAAVINYLQQVCRWKPYRMLTPTGMATADPLASNDTPEGRAQNRRVSVNVLVSKAIDGM